MAEAIIQQFDARVPSLYDQVDGTNGFLEIEDRRGQLQRFPLVSISIGIASTRQRRFLHRAEAVAVATELKNHAKRTPGSSYAPERTAGEG